MGHVKYRFVPKQVSLNQLAVTDKVLGKNEKTNHLHNQSTYEILQLMNEQDKTVPNVVESALPQIEKAVEVMVKAIEKAGALGLETVGISCNRSSELSEKAAIAIELPVGSEVITGSTRLKAGTAQKLVLNMLSTATMVRTGKVYENLMINLQAKNKKLKRRAVSIIQELTQASYEEATETYDKAGCDTKTAILMLMFDLQADKVKIILDKYNGNFVKALNRLSV